MVRVVCLVTIGLAAGAVAAVRAQDPPDAPKLVLYAQTSLAGDSRSILAAFPNLDAIDFDNRAKSVRVIAGRWEICEEKRFTRCQEVERNVMDLETLGLSRKVSSVRLLHAASPAARPAAPAVPPSGGAPHIVFFDKTGFHGGSLALGEARGNLAALTARAESVKVTSGTWQVCTGMNYTGDCTTLDGDRTDLGRWRNRIVSARPVPAAPGPPPQ